MNMVRPIRMLRGIQSFSMRRIAPKRPLASSDGAVPEPELYSISSNHGKDLALLVEGDSSADDLSEMTRNLEGDAKLLLDDSSRLRVMRDILYRYEAQI